MIGRVISIKSKNTAVVLIERISKHPLYKKTFKRSKRYLVHDLLGVNLGDMVEIINSKPISKNKSWKITKVLGKNIAEIAKEHLKKQAEEVIAEVMPEEKTEETSSPSGAHSPQTEKGIDEKQKKPKKKKGQSDS